MANLINSGISPSILIMDGGIRDDNGSGWTRKVPTPKTDPQRKNPHVTHSTTYLKKYSRVF